VGAFPLAVVLIDRTDDLQAGLAPGVGNLYGILTVDVEHTSSRYLVSFGKCEVDREVPIPVGKRIRVVVEIDFKSHPGVVLGGPGYLGHPEDRFKPGYHPSAAVAVDLLVTLPVQPIQTVVADLDFLVVVESDCFLVLATA